MLYRVPNSASRRSGVASVELAFLLPLLAFIFVVCLDWSRIIYVAILMQNGARNAAYYASEYPGVTDKMIYGYASATDAAQDDMENNLDPTLLKVTVTDGIDGSGNATKIATVSYPFSMIGNFPVPYGAQGIGVPTSVTVTRTCTMMKAPVVPGI